MSNIQDMISSLIDSIKNTGKKTNAYDTSAEVKRIEGDTAWVHIPGGVDETPVKLTINASEGDNVQVRVNGGRAWLQGNATAPPTDDTTANVARTIATDAQEEAVRAGKAADAAEAEAVRAGAAADRAEESASDALTAAQSAQTSADSALVSLATVEDVAGVLEWITNHGTMTLTSDVTVNPSHVYFVVDAGGDYVVGSMHYSIVSEPKDSELSTYYELSVDKSIQNYVATHVTVNSEGLWLIPDSNGSPTSNGKKILIATGAGSTYTSAGTYIIDRSGGVDHVYAKFLANGATMTSGNGIQIAHLGYGAGNATSGTANAPYYSLGERKTTTKAYNSSETYDVGELCVYNGAVYVSKVVISTPEAWNANHWKLIIGNYSIAEGIDAVAAGSYSHAEGGDSRAIGNMSHAECDQTYAIGDKSHAEGENTIAQGEDSHAEGYFTQATGQNSHAEGSESVASGFAAHAEGTSTASGGSAHAEGYSTASGDFSHAQNQGTVAGYANQTAIGKYNSNQSSNLFEIGNGTSSSRKNIFEVDTSGNVNIPSGTKYKINGTALAASDVGALPNSGGTVTGSLKINNHSSAIGTVKVQYASAKSVSSATNTNLTSISLEAGTWVITGGVRFPNNSTGYRRMNISTSNASGWADVQLPALSGASTQLAYTVIVSPTATTTYYLNCYHNAGTALNLVAGGSENGINFLRAVRIA